MIKCEVTLCGIVSRVATRRTTKDGKAYTNFAVKVNIPERNGTGITAEVFINREGELSEDLSGMATGNRIQVQGELTFKKRGEMLYLNMDAKTIDMQPSMTNDEIVGEMTFRGKIGKEVECKQDKKGNPYIVFSAFSTEKNGDSFNYTWVRFIRFSCEKEEYLQPKRKINAKGILDLSAFNGRINISCRVSEMSEHIPPQFNSYYQ